MIADFWPISALCLLQQKQIRWAEFVLQPMKPIMNTNEKDTALKICSKILRALHTVKLTQLRKLLNMILLFQYPPQTQTFLMITINSAVSIARTVKFHSGKRKDAYFSKLSPYGKIAPVRSE